MSTLLKIPVQTLPNQTVSTIIGSQTMTIELFTGRSGKLYSNAYLGSVPIFSGVPVIQAQYLIPYTANFTGNLFVYNFASSEDPVYSNLGTSAFLFYADYDILALNYESWVQRNLAALVAEFGPL